MIYVLFSIVKKTLLMYLHTKLRIPINIKLLIIIYIYINVTIYYIHFFQTPPPL